MVVGRVVLTPAPRIPVCPAEEPAVTLRSALGTAYTSSKKILTRLLSIIVPTIVIVAFLINAGVFDLLAGWMQGAGGVFPLPPEGFAIHRRPGSAVSSLGRASPPPCSPPGT